MRNALLAMLFLAPGLASAQAENGPWADNLFLDARKVPLLNQDFGTVPRGTLLYHRFKLTNIYNVPLEVTVTPSCTCVSASPPTQTLKPNEKGQIDITMDTRRFSGGKAVNLRITVSGPNAFSSTNLRVSAISRADIVLNPGQINFGLVARGARSVEQTLDVEYAGVLDWHVTGVDRSSAPLDVAYEELYRRPGQVGYRVRVSVRPEARSGPLKHEVFLKTSDPATPLVPILVEANIQATLAVAPNPVQLGNLKIGESITRLVLVRGPRPFHVTAVEGGQNGVTVELPAAATPVQVLKVKCQPTSAGDLHQQLRIKTDVDPDAPLPLAVEGVVEP
jgi:Protein of unknown function (DUF1573)